MTPSLSLALGIAVIIVIWIAIDKRANPASIHILWKLEVARSCICSNSEDTPTGWRIEALYQIHLVVIAHHRYVQV
jgi:hypothetical protein